MVLYQYFPASVFPKLAPEFWIANSSYIKMHIFPWRFSKQTMPPCLSWNSWSWPQRLSNDDLWRGQHGSTEHWQRWDDVNVSTSTGSERQRGSFCNFGKMQVGKMFNYDLIEFAQNHFLWDFVGCNARLRKCVPKSGTSHRAKCLNANAVGDTWNFQQWKLYLGVFSVWWWIPS